MLVVLCYAAVCCAVMLCCAVVGLSLGLDWGRDGCGVPLFWCVGGALLFWCVSGILGFGIWCFVLSCVVLSCIVSCCTVLLACGVVYCVGVFSCWCFGLLFVCVCSLFWLFCFPCICSKSLPRGNQVDGLPRA